MDIAAFKETYKKCIAELLESTFAEEKNKNFVVSPYAMLCAAGTGLDEETQMALDTILTKGDAFKLACDEDACSATFDAEWRGLFTKEDTYDEEFTNSNKTTDTVKAFHGNVHSYVKNNLLRGFVKRYKKECGYSLMALLPEKESQLEEALLQTDLIDLFANRNRDTVRVTVPAVDCEYVKKAGDKCFKSSVSINNEGTRRATFTQPVTYTGIMPSFDHTVKINRPFAFAIVNDETCLPVFIAVVNNL